MDSERIFHLARSIVKMASMRGRELTYCNEFVGLIAYCFGALALIHYKYANSQISFIRGNSNWMRLNPRDAGKYATEGHLVVACWMSADQGPGGHVCICVPGPCQKSGMHERMFPLVANVGKRNFYGKHAGYAFRKSQPPEFWLWNPRRPHHASPSPIC